VYIHRPFFSPGNLFIGRLAYVLLLAQYFLAPSHPTYTYTYACYPAHLRAGFPASSYESLTRIESKSEKRELAGPNLGSFGAMSVTTRASLNPEKVAAVARRCTRHRPCASLAAGARVRAASPVLFVTSSTSSPSSPLASPIQGRLGRGLIELNQT